MRRLSLARVGATARSGLFVALALVAILGCDDDDDATGAGGAGGEDVHARTDADLDSDRGVLSDASLLDDGVTPVRDAVVPSEDGGIRELEGCEDICAVYEGCGRDDLWETPEACMSACTDGLESASFNRYRTCMQVTRCEVLEECVVPDKPLPSCEAVCAAAAACDAEFRLPGALAEFDDCEAACESPRVELWVRECGRELPEADRAACDEPGFAMCILDHEADICARTCTLRAACDPALDAVDCALACHTGEAPEDALEAWWAARTPDCILNAGDDCAAIAACGGTAGGGRAAAAEALCAADVCGFFDTDDCQAAVTPLLLEVGDHAVECFAAAFAERCDVPPAACFVPVVHDPGACVDACAAQSVCGFDYYNGDSEYACTEACRGALLGGDSIEARRVAPLLDCAGALTCNEFGVCVELYAPHYACDASCDRQMACEAENALTCGADCLTRTLTARETFERLCWMSASCEGGAGCEVAPAPDCAPICEGLDACGLGGDDCEDACDDAHFSDPDAFLPRLACVTSTGRCSELALCEAGDLSGGDACGGWCALQVGCSENPDQTMETCLVECGGGVPGEEGLVFDHWRECLATAGPAAECGALEACMTPFDWGFCEDYCVDLGRCGLDPDVAACELSCDQNRDGDFLIGASCVVAAGRRGDGCGALAECVGAEVEPAGAACEALCAARHTCDENIDAFLCERDCVPAPAGIEVRAACSARADCEALPLCIEAEGTIPAGCVTACAEVALCPDLVGEGEGTLFVDANACAEACAVTGIIKEDPVFGDGVGACVTEAACAADPVLSCVVAGGSPCDAGWGDVETCANGIFGEAFFLESCLAMEPAVQGPYLECLARAAQDPATCGDQFLCGM